MLITTALSGSSTLAAQAQQQTEISEAQPSIDTNRWICALCPYPEGWAGNIDFGIGWVSDASNKFGDYRGLEDEGLFPALDGSIQYRDKQGRFLRLRVENLGIDSRQIWLKGGDSGKYTGRMTYREIPKYRGFGAESIFRGIGGASLTLPSGWQSANSTSEMINLAESLQPVNLKSTRRMFEAGLSIRLSHRWSYEVEFDHQTKKGTRPYGNGVFVIDASHIPAPVDFTTSQLNMGLNFKGERGHWRLGIVGSDFSNAHESFTWENPFNPVAGTEILRTSLEPGNQAYHVNLDGAWLIKPGWHLSGSAIIGRLEQDQPLLPVSINPQFSDLPLPRQTADARIDVGSLDLSGKFTARLAPRLNLTAKLQHRERDNKTPIDVWPQVRSDLLLRDPRPNRPYSFERDRALVSLRYRPGSRVRFQAGLEKENFERTLQSVTDTEEVGYFFESLMGVTATMDLRVRFEESDRDASPYLPVEDFGLTEHPLLRKFNLADRNHNRIQVDIDYFPLPELAFTVSYQQGDDDYDQSVIGLRKSNEELISFDLNWSPIAGISTHVYFSHDTFESTITGGEFGMPEFWVSNTEDKFKTTGLGFTYNPRPSTEVGFDYVKSLADGDIRTNSGANEAPFPTLTTDLRNARLRLTHRVTANWGISFYLEHENYQSTDWAIDGLGPDGISSILTFGAESPDYNVTLIRAQATYRF